MADWQPDPNGLEQIVALAASALRPENYQDTQNKIVEFNRIPDFNNYLCYAFVYGDSQQVDTRMMVGIILKENVTRYWKTLVPEVQHYVLKQVPAMLADPNRSLREHAGTLISVILAQTHIAGWPDIMEHIIYALDSDSVLLQQGTLGALEKILEDHGFDLSSPEADQHFQHMTRLVPKLLALIASGREEVLNAALKCVSHLIPHRPNALLLAIKDFLQLLFGLAEHPPSVPVLVTVCHTFNSLISGRISAITDYMNDVVQYMLMMTGSETKEVALAASNFWSTIADTSICAKALEPHLQQVTVTLLRHMKYSEDELFDMGDIDEDISTPDQPERSNPVIGKTLTGHAPESSYDTSMGTSEWTLRKSCGQALEDLTHVFQEDLLDIIIPLCEEGLRSTEWLDREASVLALGATSEAFLYCGTEHLSGIVPMLIEMQEDSRPLIRYIASWAIGRYARWIVDQGTPYLQPTIDSLSRRLKDRHKKVIEATCSALAIISEEAKDLMRDYIDDLLPIYMEQYTVFQDRAFLLLLDAIGALCESVGEALNQPHLLELLMPPLIARWNALDDTNQALLPLMDCISRIAHGLGMGFSDFAEGVWERPIRLINSNIMMKALVKEQPHLDEPDPRFLVCSLELLSAIIEGLRAGAADLVLNTNLVPLLAEACMDTTPVVMRAAFCLVGDIAVDCYPHLVQALPTILPILIANVRPRAYYVSIATNATWAVTEILIRAGEDMAPFANEIATRAVTMIHDDNLHSSAQTNAAILLGRLGGFFPHIISADLEQFVEPWCDLLGGMEDNEDKKYTFFGLLAVIKENPGAVLPKFNNFAKALASWIEPSAQLKDAFSEILAAYRQQLHPDVWNQVLATVSDETLEILQDNYM